MSDGLATWGWAASAEGEEAIARAGGELTPAAVSRLRKAYSADQVRVAAEIARARGKAAAKLDAGFTERLIADVAGVEMASSAISSRHKGARFRSVLGEGALVADLCCGIGADSWGLLAHGLGTVGVDLDPARALMYGRNTGADSVCGDALADCPVGAAGFHLDPARRTAAGRRTLRPGDYQPGPGVWAGIIDRVGSGAIKLNPGVNAQMLPAGELEILSEASGLTQAVLWVGDLAGACGRRASRLLADGSSCSLAGEASRPEESSAIGSYIATLDPCLERAELVGAFLDATGAGLVCPGTGLVTAEEVVGHPMARWYGVLAVTPWSPKRVRGQLRSLGAGVVEVRTRGGVVDPDREQKRLRGDGDRDDLSVLIYRLGDRVMAIIAEGAGAGIGVRTTPRDGGVARGCMGGLDDG